MPKIGFPSRVMPWMLFAVASLSGLSSACAQLVNGGFEDAGGSLSNWTTFNNVIPNVVADTSTPRSGGHVAKLFGGFNGNPNAAGLFQNLSATSGQTWTASAYLRHNSSDPLTGANRIMLKMEFYRVPNGSFGTPDMLQVNETEVMNAASPLDNWTLHTFQVVAPVDTVEARLVFAIVQENNAGGSVLIDDVTFVSDSTPPPPPTTWSLIWSDEFDGPTVDPAKWRIEDLHLIKNNELQYYAPDDVFIQNGSLVLRSQERTYSGYDSNGNWGQYNYTSGLVESVDRFTTAYGRIEVRAKLPGTQGIWPAHWMLPYNQQWPPEIDIMELLGHDPTRIYMSHHWGTWPNVQTFTASYNGPDFTQGFHTFAIEWLPNSIQWFVDGVLRATSVSNIPQMPFYIILNTAVGGNWPGNPDGSTVFPQFHEIDYVRVYMPDDPGPPISDFADTTLETAVPDGAINPAEYVASTQGINGGLGDRIGMNSTFYIDSGSDGRLNIGFDANNLWIDPYGVVIYLDTAPGGFVSTLDLTDAADRTRRLVSGKGQSGQQADLYFAPGFRADYAISLDLNASAIYQLAAGSLPLIDGANLDAPNDFVGEQDVIYRIDDGSSGSRIREFEARLSHFGLAPGDSFIFIVTMLNANTLFRSNEFVGVAPGNLWDSFNPGVGATVVKPGDFHRFQTIACGMLGDLNCDGIANEGDIGPFVTALIDPTAYGAGFPSCDPCTGDFDGDGSVNGLDINGFITLLTGG